MNMLMQISQSFIPPIRNKLYILILDADYFDNDTPSIPFKGQKWFNDFISTQSPVKNMCANKIQTYMKKKQPTIMLSRSLIASHWVAASTGNMHVNWQAHTFQYSTRLQKQQYTNQYWYRQKKNQNSSSIDRDKHDDRWEHLLLDLNSNQHSMYAGWKIAHSRLK